MSKKTYIVSTRHGFLQLRCATEKGESEDTKLDKRVGIVTKA